MDGHIARMEEYRSSNILTGKPLGRSRRRWLELMLEKYMSIRRIGLIRLRTGIIAEPL